MTDIRRMRDRDVAAGMRLKTIAGWNQTEEDWRLFLTLSPAGCFVAVRDDRVVGTVATVNYGNVVSWIGMLLVDPAYRRMGVGTRLMQRAIASLDNCETIKLDATPLGKSLYDRLGFQSEYGLRRMVVGSLPPLTESSSSVARIADQAFEQLAALDRHAFGADRTPVLKALQNRSPELAWWRIRHDQVRGFCLGRHGTNFFQIGPLTAETADDAVTLCGTAMQDLAGQAVVLDVPEFQDGFLGWLHGLGFTKQRSLIRMYRGSNGSPGVSRQQFVIAGPELG